MSEKINEKDLEDKDEFWSEGSFIESISSDEVGKKLKTLLKEGDLNFKCKKCNKQISSHNKDWHDCMCDDCFNKTYFK